MVCGSAVSKQFQLKNLTYWGADKITNSADDIFKNILLNENVWISIKISLKFVPKGLFNNVQSLLQIKAWGQAIIWTNDAIFN